MLIAFIVIIVLAILASMALAGKAIHLWVVVPYVEDRTKHADVVWQQRMNAKMLILPSVFLFIFGLDLNSLVDRTGGGVPLLFGILLCSFFAISSAFLGFETHKTLNSDPDRKDEDVMNVWIGISMYISIICMMILGSIIQSEFLTPMNIGIATLATGLMMSKGINEIEFPGSEFIRAGIIFTIIGGLIFWYNYLNLNWF
jgi:hypothetical protein